jgi:photosystem II stability/assembly factor-like uncharacterized protein
MEGFTMRRPVLSTTVLLFTLAAYALLPNLAAAWPSPGHHARPIPQRSHAAHADLYRGRPAARLIPSFLTGAALLTGHVYDVNGAPVSGASVGWIVEGTTTAKGSGRTNASGLYSFGSVPAAVGNGTVWCAPADGSWELARLDESWPDPGATTVDFAPAGMPVSLVRGGPWKDWPAAWIQLSGSDERGAVLAGGEIKGVRDDDTYISPTVGTAATLPGVYETGAVNFWANEGLEFTTVTRSGPGSQRVLNPITLPSDLSFPDHRHGWVVGGTQVCRTTDAGRTWTTQYSGPAYLMSVAFADSLHGIAVGALPSSPPEAFAMWTADGGATWTPSETDLKTGDYYQMLRDVECLDAQHAWAVGDSGLIYSTADGGRTWAPQVSGTTLWLTSVSFADLQHGWVCGQGDTILATTDGGLTWAKQHEAADQTLPQRNVLAGIDALDALRAWAVGDYGTAFLTTDGGDTWQPMHPTAGESTDDDYRQVEFVDAEHGWLAGQGPGVMATTDGGLTWTFQINRYADIIGIDMDGPSSGAGLLGRSRRHGGRW